VARQSARATEAQAPLLLAGSAVAYVVGPACLGAVIPRYVDGLPALRPLLPGMILLALAWPARQMLIAVGRSYSLCLATLLGFGVTVAAGTIGADRAGIVGVAWGMTIGYTAVFVLTSATAVVPWLGVGRWVEHMTGLCQVLGGFALATLLTAHVPLGYRNRWLDLAARSLLLSMWLLPALWFWGRRHGWGGLFEPRSATRK
jgi:O-antigen/teichoic acid export membrane protein